MLYLIINKNEGLLNERALNIFKEEEIERHNIQESNLFYNIKTKGLFHNRKIALWVKIFNKEDLKKNIEILENTKDEDILKTTLVFSINQLQGTSKIEKIFTRLKGIIIKDNNLEVKDFLKDFNLKKECIEVLEYYTGTSFDKLVPLMNTLKDIEEEKRKKFKVDDILSFISNIPGERPIYEFLNPLLKGDTLRTSKDIDLLLKSYHPLILFTTLKNKIFSINRFSIIYQNTKKTPKEIKEFLEMKSDYPIKLVKDIYTDRELTEKLIKKVIILENNLKGKSKVSIDLEFKSKAIEMSFLIKENKIWF